MLSWICAETERAVRRDELAAAGQHRDPRARCTEHPRAADGRQQGDVPRTSARCRAGDDLSDADVLAGATDMGAGVRRLTDGDGLALRPPPVHSTGTTASAPSGSGAPVMIRTAPPGASAAGRDEPAAASPATGSTTGASAQAPATSAARTAKPSMEELSKPGRATGEATS